MKAASDDGQFVVSGSSDESSDPGIVEFITSERVKVVAMLALALGLCNADRVVMSVVIVPISLSRGWGLSFSGLVQVNPRACRSNLSCVELIFELEWTQWFLYMIGRGMNLLMLVCKTLSLAIMARCRGVSVDEFLESLSDMELKE